MISLRLFQSKRVFYPLNCNSFNKQTKGNLLTFGLQNELLIFLK